MPFLLLVVLPEVGMVFEPVTVFLMLANFLGAFAGAGAIARGIEFLHGVDGFKCDSLLAFLIGTLISLGGILYLKHFIIRLGGWLSIAGVGLCFLLYRVLFYAEEHASSELAWVAFGLLCLYFTLIFVPRTFRSDLASKLNGQLSWVEFSYALGSVVGLLVWKYFPETHLYDVVLINSVCLALAAFFDFKTRSYLKSTSEVTVKVNASSAALDGIKENPIVLKQIMLVVVLLTLAVQIVSQRLCSLLSDTTPLIAFQVGVFIAPLVIQLFGFSLIGLDRGLGLGVLKSRISSGGWRVAFIPLIIAVFMGGASYSYSYGIVGSSLGFGLIVVAAFIYELFCIVGFEAMAHLTAQRGMVATTFGIMGITAMLLYWVLIQWNLGVPSLILLELLLVVTCAVVLLKQHFQFAKQKA